MEPLILMLIFIPVLGISILLIVSMWIVFNKAGQPGWAVIVPFYNYWVMARVGDRPGYLGLVGCFVGFIPVIGVFIGFGLAIYIGIGIAATFDRGIWFGLGLTFLPWIFYPILAFSRDKSETYEVCCYKIQE